MTRCQSLIFALFMVSVSGISAKSPEADILSLISSSRSDSVAVDKEAVTLSDTVADLCDILSLVTREKAGHQSASSFTTGIEALSTVTDAFSDAGFYSSGAWVKDENIIYPPGMCPPVSGVKYPSSKPVVITSPFGYRESRDRMHHGVDIAMSVGDSVNVAMPGTVSSVRYDPKGYGHYIIIVHDNGLESRYAHLDCPLVEVGRRVAAGMPIALSGNTGNSTGPHLHLEIRYRGVPVDPRLVFDFH